MNPEKTVNELSNGHEREDERTEVTPGKRVVTRTSSHEEPRPHPLKAIIIGAGIGGLTTALFLNKHGIDCEVFEQAAAIQELGVGINLMPQAIASFDEIGLLAVLEQSGIAPDRLFYRTAQGLTVWDEPRGRRAGLPYPQISIHRGRLQRLLHDAFEARAPGRVHVDRTFASWYENGWPSPSAICFRIG
ncbi:hypothetical protein FJ417_27695 [Mesorhizobium sp. B3-1-7]|uniref:FAD-dependent monooxygenase n=1 Tax=Mesorhizobium sp. B3-1-7 TaxID=2589894 RepID=UPI00112EF147|nr:FAD-dependent monooxygenase [Mesorhizobium sp. B3-1-7]TPI51908.1 hypothetical protein FJ417_27695 [Mesorhizobium sp. B3-1-7]